MMMEINKADGQYEVLSPWAEADPIPLKSISPRVTDLKGKKIGLFCNLKRSARPILALVEEKLKVRFPSSEISWYVPQKFNVPEIETEGRARFEKWVKEVDTVIAAFGD